MANDDFDTDFDDDDFEGEEAVSSDDDFEDEGIEADDDDDLSFDDEDDDEEDDLELQEFSEAQQAKIKRALKRVEEERDEAMRFAASADQAAKRALARAHDSDRFAVGEVKQSAEASLKRLKEELKDAIELGDADKQVELNEKISDALLRKRAAEDAEETFKNGPRVSQDVVPQPQPGDEQRWNAWREKNKDWFDTTGQSGDPVLTGAALGIDADLKRKGVRVNSPEYYAKIDERMRELFPAKFGAAKKKKPNGSQRGGSASSPMSRRSPNGSGRIMRMTASQRAVARRLNLTDQQYMKEYAKYNKESGE